MIELFVNGDADFGAVGKAFARMLAHAKYDEEKHVIKDMVLRFNVVDKETGDPLRIIDEEEGYEMTAFRINVNERNDKPAPAETEGPRRAKRKKRYDKPDSSLR